MKLLLIDSDPTFARHMQRQLRQRGTTPLCKLVHVADVDHAADLAARHDFDAMLVSLTNVDQELNSVCQRLAWAAPDIPVVGLVDEKDARPIEELPDAMGEVLAKPDMDANTLVQWVQRAKQRHRTMAVHSSAARVARPVALGSRSRSLARTHESSTAPAAAVSPAAARPGTPAKATAGVTREGPEPPLRVLQVDGDAAYSRLLESTLASTMQVQCDVQRVGKLADALHCLVEQAYDVILLDPTLPDAKGIDSLKELHAFAEQAPIFLLTKEEDAEQSLAGLSEGAADCHSKSQLDANVLARSIRLALDRRARQETGFQPRVTRSKPTAPPVEENVEPYVERRSHPRFAVSRAMLAIPLLPNGLPLVGHQAEGVLLDISQGGLGFELAGCERLAAQRFVIGTETEDAQLHYTTVEVRNARSTRSGLRVGAQFAAPDRDVLSHLTREPRIDPKTHRYSTGLAQEVVEQWVKLGVCRPVFLDRVLVCPECQALASFRHGCPACGSAHTENQQLLHHFACAHVDLVCQFEDKGDLVCPKCRARHLVVGTDYEFLAGPYHCRDCHSADADLAFVGQCLACELRFPIGQASEQDIVGYHVHRLDPLALITTYR